MWFLSLGCIFRNMTTNKSLVTLICPNCSGQWTMTLGVYKARTKNRKTALCCSVACANKCRISRGKLQAKECLRCNVEFATYHSKQKFCSRTCSDVSDKATTQCDNCLCLFEFFDSTLKWKQLRNKGNPIKNYCSVVCYQHHYTGHLTPNWIEDRSQIKNKDKSIRASKQMVEWRKHVFERDQYTCQECKRKGTHIQAHHIVPYSLDLSLAFEPINGITLCIGCHRKTFKKEALFEARYKEIVASK